MSILLAACLVVAMHDADTATVRCPQRAKTTTVRVAGIDAPEMAAFTWKTQPYAVEARNAAQALCMSRPADVRLLKYDSRTKRWIGTLDCGGVDLSHYLVQHGYAWSFMADAKSDLPALMKQAQGFKSGLWADPAAVAPSEWRKPLTGCK